MDPALPPSFVEATISNVKLQDENDQYKSLPTWMKFLIKVGLVLIALILFILGLVGFFGDVLTLDIGGVFACIFLILTSLIVTLLEAPILLSFIKFLDPVKEFSQNRPPWQKMILYLICAIIVIACSQGITIIVGFLLIMVIVLVYFYLTFNRARR